MAAGLPSAVLVEIEFSAGVWTDVGSLVKGDSIEIHVGRDSAASGIQPGTLDLDLDNADGRFTPDNPTSTHYPNFVEGKRIRVRVTKSATTYVRFVGRITAIEPDFPTEPSQSRTHVAAVDLLGDLARITLPHTAEGYARVNDAGTAVLYPLNDIDEHAGMVDVLGGAPSLEVWFKSASTGRIDAVADESLGDGLSYVKLFAGKGLWGTNVISDAFSMTALVKVSSSSYGEVLSVSEGRRDVATDYHSLRWTSDGFVVDTYEAGVLSGSTATIPALDGWHYVSVGGPSGGLIVDAGASTPLAASLNPNSVSIGGDVDMSAAWLLLTTTTALVPASPSAYFLTRSPSSALNILGVIILDSDLQATLAWTSTPTGDVYLDTYDRTALDAITVLADSQSGYVYAVPSTSASQTVQLVATADARPTTVALTVDAEGDLDGGPTLVRALDDVVSTATANGPRSSVTVFDSSVTGVGTASTEVDTALASSIYLHAVASDRIARGRDQKTRLTSLTIDLATASNDLYASLYAVTPGERLRLSGLPTTYFGVSYIDGYVEGWTERPGVNGYEVVFDLSPADAPSEARYDTGRYAFGDGVCTVTGGTAVGTTSTGTITLTWATSPTLSTAAGDYPMDFDWNGERVTVTSAPAGGTSPRTLTITARGVAPTVARSHSAGESIEPWDAARYAL